MKYNLGFSAEKFQNTFCVALDRALILTLYHFFYHPCAVLKLLCYVPTLDRKKNFSNSGRYRLFMFHQLECRKAKRYPKLMLAIAFNFFGWERCSLKIYKCCLMILND